MWIWEIFMGLVIICCSFRCMSLQQKVNYLTGRRDAIDSELAKKIIETSELRGKILGLHQQILHERAQHQRFWMDAVRNTLPTPFTKKEITDLIKLCHPDKHGGSETANTLTRKLLQMR